jgi:HK97 family phage major capsid protein
MNNSAPNQSWPEGKLVSLASLGISPNEYSYARALKSALSKGVPGAVPDGLEGEVHQEIGRQFRSVTPGGFWVPWDRMAYVNRADLTKLGRAANDLQVGVFGQGGAGVATEGGLPVIDLLRNKMISDRIGVRTITGCEGNILWPRQVSKSAGSGAGGSYWVPETFALTDTNPLLDQVGAVPHRVGVSGRVSKQLILQFSPDAQNWLRDDQLLTLAVEMDRVCMFGAGANSEPTGIFNTIGIGSVNFGGITPTYAKIRSFKSALALANALADGMAFVTTPSVEEKLATTPKIGTTFPIYIWEDGDWGDSTADGKMVGLRATSTNQVPNDRVGFGNFKDAAKLLWGPGIDTIVDPYTGATEAMVRIVQNVFMDVLVRHQGSFVISSDAGNN